MSNVVYTRYVNYHIYSVSLSLVHIYIYELETLIDKEDYNIIRQEKLYVFFLILSGKKKKKKN